MYVQRIYNRGRVPKLSLSCIDSSSLWTDRPSAFVVLLWGSPQKRHLHPLEISIVLHGPTHSDLALLSVITHNPTLKPQVFYYQQFTVF